MIMAPPGLPAPAPPSLLAPTTSGGLGPLLDLAASGDGGPARAAAPFERACAAAPLPLPPPGVPAGNPFA